MSLVTLWQNLHFLRPVCLLVLPLLWALVIWLASRSGRGGGWETLIDAELLPALRLDANERRSASPWPWLALAWTVAAIALAGPSWQRSTRPAYRSPAAWVFVLDLSPSMAAGDLAPNRASRARFALDDLLGTAHDAQVALIAFSEEPYTVTPLTQDVANVRSLLPSLAPDIMPTEGDHLAPALVSAGKLLAQAGGKDRHIVVLSDGFDDPSAALAEASKLKSQGIDINVVGIGTSSGAPLRDGRGHFVQDDKGKPAMARLDRDGLQQLARTGGGQYVDIGGVASLGAALQASPLPGSAVSGDGRVEVADWRDAGAWLMPLVLFIAALLARRGWL
jgi:Ca-activated chloride channel family protein